MLVRLMLRRCACAAALSAVVAAVPPAPPRGGTVLVVDVGEAGTGAFVPGAEVILPDARLVARTDWQGEAVIRDLPAKPTRVQVRRLGYASSEITIQLRGDTSSIFFSLERVPVTTDTMRTIAQSVPVRLQEFETRRRMGIGRFLTDSALQAEHQADLAIMFAAHFPGLRVGDDGEGGFTAITCRSAVCSDCNLYLDGMRYVGGLASLQPADLAGVEYYDLVSEPAEYAVRGGYSECTILMWSKRW